METRQVTPRTLGAIEHLNLGDYAKYRWEARDLLLAMRERGTQHIDMSYHGRKFRLFPDGNVEVPARHQPILARLRIIPKQTIRTNVVNVGEILHNLDAKTKNDRGVPQHAYDIDGVKMATLKGYFCEAKENLRRSHYRLMTEDGERIFTDL
jgi:hypothetical protein